MRRSWRADRRRFRLPARPPQLQLDPPLSQSPSRPDDRARIIHLPPGVPEQHASNLVFLEIIDHALAEAVFPNAIRLQSGCQLDDCFAAESQEVRVVYAQV